MTPDANLAIRSRIYVNGKTHLDSGRRRNPATQNQPVSKCGRAIRDAEHLPWESTAPEDRCGQCARRKGTA